MNQSPLTGKPVIAAADLTLGYAGHKVLHVPALDVLPNEVLVILGPNGCGKTTLLLTLASLLRPMAGTVRYWGQAVSAGELLRLRRRFAVAFQEPLLLSATVWDNVTLGLRLRRVPRSEMKARGEKWLARFGIASLVGRQAKMLSGGEAKRVSLARAFALQPEVLFLDEAFNGLDSPTRQAIIEDFEGVMRETKVTTVMVTHERDEALALASRVAVIVGGRIRQIDAPGEVFSCPADEEVASFIGAGNVLPGAVVSQAGGIAMAKVGVQTLEAVSGMAAGSNVVAFLRHEDVTLSLPSTKDAPSSARNRLAGTVVRVFPAGAQMRVTVDCGFPLVALITRRSWEEMGLAVGGQVVASFKASSIHLIPRLERMTVNP